MKKKCGTCRYWSEMLAQSVGGGPIEAVCLSQAGSRAGKWVPEYCTCEAWAENTYGAVDIPGAWEMYEIECKVLNQLSSEA